MNDKSKFYITGDKSTIFGEDILSPLGRIAFVNLAKPEPKYNRYGLSLLVDKKDPKEVEQLKKIQAQCGALAQAFFGEKWQEAVKKLKHPPLRNGDEQQYDGYPGSWVIVANTKFGANHSKGFAIRNEDMEADSYEAGMICRLEIQPGISREQGFFYKLRAIKKVKDDGKRFDGAPPAGSLLDTIDDAVEEVTTGAGFGDL